MKFAREGAVSARGRDHPLNGDAMLVRHPGGRRASPSLVDPCRNSSRSGRSGPREGTKGLCLARHPLVRDAHVFGCLADANTRMPQARPCFPSPIHVEDVTDPDATGSHLIRRHSRSHSGRRAGTNSLLDGSSQHRPRTRFAGVVSADVNCSPSGAPVGGDRPMSSSTLPQPSRCAPLSLAEVGRGLLGGLGGAPLRPRSDYFAEVLHTAHCGTTSYRLRNVGEGGPEFRDVVGRVRWATMLVVALAAVLAGTRSLAGIAEWANDLPVGQAPTRDRSPAGQACPRPGGSCSPWTRTCSTRFCARGWSHWPRRLRSRRPCERSRSMASPVAVRTATGRGGPSSIVEHGCGVPLGQVNAGDRDHEIAAFAMVLARIDLHGVVVMADALHTQNGHAHYLHRHHGHYLFIVKRNRPTLHDRLSARPWADIPAGHHSQEKSHGRRESRTLQVVSLREGSRSRTLSSPPVSCVPARNLDPATRRARPALRSCTRSPASAGTKPGQHSSPA